MKKMRRLITSLLTLLLSVILIAGCGVLEAGRGADAAGSSSEVTAEAVMKDQDPEDTGSRSESSYAESGTGKKTGSEDTEAEEPYTGNTDETSVERDGVYTSKEDVALYIHTFGELPDNFITKKEARSLGWSGGSLEPYAPGKTIGGDHFGNYEGALPEDASYTECDIDTLGADKRGAKRIIFDRDGNIYYTEDHYETFEKLY